MTFRSPLRNEWDRVVPQFQAMAKAPGRDGVMARMMLAVMPGFIDTFEKERDRNTAPRDFFEAVAATSGMMIEEAIEKQKHHIPPSHALQGMLQLIHDVVRPRVLTQKQSRLIIPGDI